MLSCDLPELLNDDGEAVERPLEELAPEPAPPTPERQICDGELVDWFLSDSCHAVARTLGLKAEQVQRLRSEIMGIDRAEVEAARIELGYTERDWQAKRLAVGLIRERAETMRQNLKAPAA